MLVNIHIQKRPLPIITKLYKSDKRSGIEIKKNRYNKYIRQQLIRKDIKMHKFTMFITAVCVSVFLMINFSDSSLQ